MSGGLSSKKSLNDIFDRYRGTPAPSRMDKPILIFSDDPKDNPNGIGIDGAMKFLGDIQVQLDEVACLGVFEMCQCPSMGEFTREGFVEGWKGVKYILHHQLTSRMNIKY